VHVRESENRPVIDAPFQRPRDTRDHVPNMAGPLPVTSIVRKSGRLPGCNRMGPPIRFQG
jgi:hypothetical protein